MLRDIDVAISSTFGYHCTSAHGRAYSVGMCSQVVSRPDAYVCHVHVGNRFMVGGRILRTYVCVHESCASTYACPYMKSTYVTCRDVKIVVGR